MEAFRLTALALCIAATLAGPFLSRRVERRLELFLLAMGALAATLGGAWNEAVVLEALLRPLQVCLAVLLGALVFSFSHEDLRRAVRRTLDRVGAPAAVGLCVLTAGLSAALITSAVAVLLLVELLYALRLERESEAHAAVLGCFAVGLGAGLSPIGGPVPAIAMAKLSGPPYYASGAFLWDLLGTWVIPAIVTLAAVSALFAKPAADRERPLTDDPYSLWNILLLTGRMYVFIAGLILLGMGAIRAMDRLVLGAEPGTLYWINALSALVDGATLASVELSPNMTLPQLRYVLMGILAAGGALVPGNAPNLVASHKLGISYRDWARIGLPAGGLLMLFYYLSLRTTAG